MNLSLYTLYYSLYLSENIYQFCQDFLGNVLLQNIFVRQKVCYEKFWNVLTFSETFKNKIRNQV